MKNIISAIMVVVLLLSFNAETYAKDTKIIDIENAQNEYKGYEFLLDSVVYLHPSQRGAIGIGTKSYSPGYGTAKIDDVLMSSSSITDVTDADYTKYETAKYLSIKILKQVPGIGDVYSRLEDIYNEFMCS